MTPHVFIEKTGIALIFSISEMLTAFFSSCMRSGRERTEIPHSRCTIRLTMTVQCWNIMRALKAIAEISRGEEAVDDNSYDMGLLFSMT